MGQFFTKCFDRNRDGVIQVDEVMTTLVDAIQTSLALFTQARSIANDIKSGDPSAISNMIEQLNGICGQFEEITHQDIPDISIKLPEGLQDLNGDGIVDKQDFLLFLESTIEHAEHISEQAKENDTGLTNEFSGILDRLNQLQEQLTSMQKNTLKRSPKL